MLAVYSGAKSYNDFFTQALKIEYASHGITFQCVLPGLVVSNMSKIRKPSLMVPSPNTFVKSALARLGIDDRTCGYWFHDIMMLAIDTFPRSMIANYVYGQSQIVKKRALKKMEKEKQKWISCTTYLANMNQYESNEIDYGCVVVPWHFEFYVMKCKKFKM